jgi:type IV secretion system protein VirB8
MNRRRNDQHEAGDADPNLRDLTWERDVYLNTVRSRTIAWRVAAGAGALALLLGAGIVTLLPLKTVVPHVVMVDKLTGEGQVVAPAQQYVATSELSDKHWVSNYLVSRERYVYRFIQYDYDTVQLLSGAQPWSNYKGLFEGANALDAQYKDNVEVIPRVLSITLNGGGIATVRYELRTKDYRVSAVPTVTRRVATLRFEYQARNLTLEKDAIANPLGFTVTAYQTDPELGGDAKGVQ